LFFNLKLFSYLKHFTVMAAVNKVHPDFECIDKYVHISVYYINDSHISFILFSIFDHCYCFNYQYSFQKNVTVFSITFPTLWLFIPFVCYNEWMNEWWNVCGLQMWYLCYSYLVIARFWCYCGCVFKSIVFVCKQNVNMN